ncbi:hypothetical protein K1T71_015099 [Dendrolimus kikuchii]|nr:hypothetical protein K1T71_015099 [Dendrolimus kikuchii]
MERFRTKYTPEEDEWNRYPTWEEIQQKGGEMEQGEEGSPRQELLKERKEKKAGYYCPPDAPFLTTSNKKPSCDGAVPVSLTVHSQTPALRVEEAATPYLIVPEGPLPSREVLLRGPTTTR